MQKQLFLLISFVLTSCDFTSPKTYLAQAKKYENKNEFKEAIKILDRAIAKDENYLPAYINRAVDKAMLGDYKSAIRDYDIVLQKDTNNTLALLNRGKNKHRLYNYSGAIEDFNKAIKTKGSEAAYLEIMPNGPIDSGYECSMESIRLERCVSLYFIHDLKGAYSDVEFCVERNFEPAIALYFRGIILLSANKKEAGCRDLHKALAMGNPDAIQEIRRYCK